MNTTPSTRTRCSSALCIALGLFFTATPAQSEQIGPYSSRSLTLGAGTVRIDGGPPDWGYFHPGSPQWINENRGLRLRANNEFDNTEAWFGLGVAVGVTNEVELGGLLLPVRLAPNADLDDLELYGRLALVEGDFELGGQATLQLPTMTETGLGLGLPMLIHAGTSLRIDTGFEVEVLFWDPDTAVNLDLPLALTWDIGRRGFLGPRTGVYLVDFDGFAIPVGLHGGGVFAKGHLDVAGWFMWPTFLGSNRDHPIEVNNFELGFGLNARID